MAITDFLDFMIDNPWVFLIIGTVVSGLLIYQIILFNKMRRQGKVGAMNIIVGFIVAIITIILILLFWTFLIYDVGDAEVAWILLVIIFMLAGPITATVFVTIGFRQLSEGSIKVVSKSSKQHKGVPPF